MVKGGVKTLGLGKSPWVNLIRENENNFNPCASTLAGAAAQAATDSRSSGVKRATITGDQNNALTAVFPTAQFDTSILDPNYNYAVCYLSGDHTVGSGPDPNYGFFDSGIRVTVSRVAQIQYNKQTSPNQNAGGAAYVAQLNGPDYTRVMTSTNAYPATDINPVATNRVAASAVKMDFEYNGNGASINDGQFIALVAIDLIAEGSETKVNEWNPCAT